MPDLTAPGGVTTGAIVRSLTELSLGTLQAAQARAAADWQDASDEYDQQFRLPLTFTLAGAPVTADVGVTFDVGFVMDAVERQNPYDRPQFSYGFEHISGDPPLLTAMVVGWIGGNGLTTGATIRVIAAYPQTRARAHKRRWSGLLHANFQGYASPLPDPDATDLE